MCDCCFKPDASCRRVNVAKKWVWRNIWKIRSKPQPRDWTKKRNLLPWIFSPAVCNRDRGAPSGTDAGHQWNTQLLCSTCADTAGCSVLFLVSGFFLQKKIQDVQKVKAYLARIFQLYVIYTVLYMPQIVYDYRKAGGFWGWNLLDFVRNFHLAKHLRSLSVLYFGLHKWIEFYFVGLLHRALGVELNSLARFVLVVVLNYIAAEVIIRMSAIRHFQWLRKLYWYKCFLTVPDQNLAR